MQKVILVNEDNHGFLCVAKDYQEAIKYLIQNSWLTEDMPILVGAHWVELSKENPNWREDVKNLSIKEFNEIFEESFYLSEQEVFGT